MIVLASGSASRRAMLEAAAVPFEVVRPQVDEDAAKEALKAEGIEARGLADALAELKAVAVSRRMPGRTVIGSDSVMALADGRMLDKPDTRERAAEQLRMMRGGSHRLVSAVVGARDGVPVWRHVDVAKLQVRDFSDAFLESYLDAEWPAISGCVGCFRIEGPGVQLFGKLEGSQFTILGMPLMPLLGWLRDIGEMPA
ncbi:Maf family protein [Sphingomonas oryzagri]|jgi:septum formation protein|uniref:Nucleoside triphosphate pyrophosphatase n=1 Tax=Sphingomonas oryzagri TaxID=3042314 RepID=A0ABT6N534_9SPHN|nr:nucleoside triphosphate pyrophosphatase [Sphingomonas oryzagri]MDH7640212.1 nucleoside triphosphate pyrophosphatase [Sphingomonas oryzagri]